MVILIFFMLFFERMPALQKKCLEKRRNHLVPFSKVNCLVFIDFFSVKHFDDDNNDVFLTTAPVSMRSTDAMIVFKHHNIMCYILGAKYFHSHLQPYMIHFTFFNQCLLFQLHPHYPLKDEGEDSQIPGWNSPWWQHLYSCC